MIYILLSFLIAYFYPFGSDIIAEVTFGVTFLLNIGISLIMLPINIRLAGQLVMQVFKYRYICNHVATLDEDNKVMRGYYNHFRAVMCIIISMVGFNVFNIISEVLFLIKFFKWEWSEIWRYWWVAEGLCCAFEESIILYAVVMLYQIACYFQGQKFRFFMITVIIVLRFLYTSIQTGFVINFLLSAIGIPMYYQVTNQGLYKLLMLLLFSSIIILEFLLRFPMLFSFVRSTQRVVSKYINEFLNDMNTDDLDRQHFVDKVLAAKLFQIAGWGTIFVSFMTSLVLVLQYSMMISIILLTLTRTISIFVLRLIAVTIFTIIQVFTILPSILYCIFLITLWLYFRNKSKVKYSGYNSDAREILIRVHRPKKDVILSNQDEFHDTYYKRKYTIMYSTYVLCIVVISVLFAGFFAPVLDNRWTWDISLRPGDYHLLDESILKSGCYNHQYERRIEQHSLFESPLPLSCNENILAAEIIQNETHDMTINFNTPYGLFWLPKNSILIQQIPPYTIHYNYYLPSLIVKSQFPCYYFLKDAFFYYIYQLNFNNLLTKDSCKGAELILDSDTLTYQPHCHYTNVSGELNCTIMYAGMYELNNTLPHQNISVKQFRHAINESTIIPLKDIEGEQLQKYDIITLNSTVDMTDAYNLCSIHATCRFHLAFRILMPVLILLSSMLLLAIGLILILKI